MFRGILQVLKTTKIGRDAKVSFDQDALKALLKGIEEKLVVRVGILGEKPREQEESKSKTKKEAKKEPLSNADIGLIHEKGSKSRNIPRRSWLQVPLEDHLPKFFSKLGPEVIQKIIQEQNVKAYELLGIECERLIEIGFDTRGYGKWPAIKISTAAHKGSDAILIDSGQLRKSVTSAVVAK